MGGCGGGWGRSWSFADTRDFDEGGPGDEEGGVVLPVEGTFEEISAGTVGWSVYECDPSLRGGVVYFDALFPIKERVGLMRVIKTVDTG